MGPRVRRTGAVWATLTVAALAATFAAGANGAQTVPKHSRHCGLFRSAVEWTENAQIHGQFYSYGVIRVKCRFDALLPMRVAVLTLHGATRPDGFHCSLLGPTLKAGYCYKGNLKKPSKVKWVVWAPEVDCADPNPPYTADPLPKKCHT